MHSHAHEEEAIYLIEGTGELHVGDGTPRVLRPGTLIFIPPGCLHAIINIGTEPLRMIIVYAPPGPERELECMEGCRISPPRIAAAIGPKSSIPRQTTVSTTHRDGPEVMS